MKACSGLLILCIENSWKPYLHYQSPVTWSCQSGSFTAWEARDTMMTFSVLLALCAGNSPVTGEFPSQRPVTQSFDVFFDLNLNKCLSKQLRHRWFEMPLPSLCHCNGWGTWYFFFRKLNKLVNYGLVMPYGVGHLGDTSQWNLNQCKFSVKNTSLSLGARLHYLQCVSSRDTAVLHKAIEISSAKCKPFCSSLNVLIEQHIEGEIIWITTYVLALEVSQLFNNETHTKLNVCTLTC